MGDRMRLAALAMTAAALMAPPLALGAPPESQISVRDDRFVPSHPAARDFGATFSWRRQAGAFNEHNVRQVAGLFRSGPPTTDSFTPADPYSISPSSGTYRYFCDAHRALRMQGKIKVRPIVEAGTLSRHEFKVQWARRNGNHTGSRFDVRYRVDSRRWKVWKNDTANFHGTLGARDRPVRVSPAHDYRIEVRSEKRKVKRRSDWSPPLVVSPR
jgi:hypothetical protein